MELGDTLGTDCPITCYERTVVPYWTTRDNGYLVPPELGDLQNLGTLHLSHNELTGSIPPELGDLQNLGALYLDGNALTGPLPGELGNIRTLRAVRIDGNPLTGPLPRELLGLRLTIFHWENTDLRAPT